MKKSWILLIAIISTISCKSEFKKHELLIDFKVETKSPEKLYQIEGFREEDNWDIIRKMKTEQIADTLQISFNFFEGGSTEIKGNIDISHDTLFLKIGKGMGVKELVIHNYLYKVLNPENKKYKIEVKNNIEIEDLRR